MGNTALIQKSRQKIFQAKIDFLLTASWLVVIASPLITQGLRRDNDGRFLNLLIQDTASTKKHQFLYAKSNQVFQNSYTGRSSNRCIEESQFPSICKNTIDRNFNISHASCRNQFIIKIRQHPRKGLPSKAGNSRLRKTLYGFIQVLWVNDGLATLVKFFKYHRLALLSLSS